MALSSRYDPKLWESKVIDQWRASGYGSPEAQIKFQQLSETSPTYTIVMPPPNLTAKLHAGHALNHYIEDTLSRYHRMKGDITLLFPGVDHAGIQLEGVINAYLQSKGIDRKKLSREEYLKICWEKVNEWRNGQNEQAKIIGTSADYTRELFTLDPRACEMVAHAFESYYNDDLIYKSAYIVNWSVGLQTALSDVSGEIEYRAQVDPLVSFTYGESTVEYTGRKKKIQQSLNLFQNYLKQHPFTVSTVRPETVFGDVAIAVHPEIVREGLSSEFDSEYVDTLIQSIEEGTLQITNHIPELELSVRVLLSEKVDKNFGNGALKVTPASDFFDYTLYHDDFKKYGLRPFIQAVGRDGCLTDSVPEPYRGLKREQARVEVVKHLWQLGHIPRLSEPVQKKTIPELYRDIPDIEYADITWNYEHNVAICERSKTVIEPLVSEEFFLSFTRPTYRDGSTLAELGMKGVAQTRFFTAEYQTRATKFLEGIHDWCISRDLSWGHPLPVWYNIDVNPEKQFLGPKVQTLVKNGQTIHARDMMRVQMQKPADAGTWVQEEKILDTWFSSCLWPLTTLGYHTTNPKIEAMLVDLNGVVVNDQGELHKEVYEFLRTVARTGVRLYYWTQASLESVAKIESLFDEPIFVGGMSMKEYSFTKTQVQSYEYALKHFNLKPHKTLLIDDRIDCTETAAKAGIRTIWVTPETNLRESFEHIVQNITSDFEKFYPTSSMSTAKEIFYVWIVRMIVVGMYFTGHTPFHNVLIHPTVLDGAGKKMSKSLGNGLQPEEAIAEFSSDILRFALLAGTYPNRNMRFGGDVAHKSMTEARNFGNKLWNIARFLEKAIKVGAQMPLALSDASHWMLGKIEELENTIHDCINVYEFGTIIEKIIDTVWNTYADFYVEYIKDNSSEMDVAGILYYRLLQLIHPFLPIETSVIAQEVFQDKHIEYSLIHTKNSYNWSSEASHNFSKVIEVVQAIRSHKGLFGIPPQTKIRVTKGQSSQFDSFIARMCSVEWVERVDDRALKITVAEQELMLDIADTILRPEDELKKTQKLYTETQTTLHNINARLENQGFLEKAGEEAVSEAQKHKARLILELANIESKRTYLQSLLGKSSIV